MMQKEGLKKIQRRVAMTLLFYLACQVSALASTPTLGTISPSSGTSLPDVARTFTCKYNDASGWAHLKEVYLLISTSSTALTNSAYLYYDQNTNLLYVRNDANGAWLGGKTPASANTIENSYVRLNCASTTVSGSGNTLTVNWNITFKAAYSGRAYKSYLYAKDDAGASVGWTQKGTYTVNRAPQVGTISPSSGTGQADVAQVFTATYTDADGWQNIQLGYLLINSSTTYVNCFYGYYNQNTNKLYLRNDANTSWLGGYAPGTSNVIENSFAKLECSGTSVSGSSATMTINWKVTLKAPFTGAKKTYLYVSDDVGAYQGWVQKGTWTLPNQAPVCVSVSPSTGSSYPDSWLVFSAVYSDADGYLNLKYAYLLINTTASGANCFYGYYNRQVNKLYIRNDANTGWTGGYAPGTANVIQNSYAKLDCAQTTVSGSGNNLTINWKVTFKAAFTGVKNTYLYITDNADSIDGWDNLGDYCIYRQPVSAP